MSNIRSVEETENLRKSVLHAAAKLFLTQGYSSTSVREISELSGISSNAIFYEMKNKEEILCELVKYVLEGQFEAAKKMVNGKTEDKILFYAAETTLQLYIAESSEHMRELYNSSYSMSNTSDVIQHTITGKLEHIFKEHLPDLETKDFYELEIASGGIMRGFMTIPCDMYFTMERKVRRFIETTFLVYRVPQSKIDEAIEFVSQFDYPALAQNTIDNMLAYLESRT
ncbi:MAG: TetR/AcrR family transcriptional regulator [Clostridia bacterium]|nr:TetR/AcrR family transcriptional regulator [Clostridia bacterium]